MIPRLELALAIALLTPLATAQFPPAPGNPGASCHWLYPPSILVQLCNTTVIPLGVGTLTKTHCSKGWYGQVEWTMKTYADHCEPVVEQGYTYITLPFPGLPPIVIPVPVTTSYKYTRVCTGITSTIHNVLAIQQCCEVHFSFDSQFSAPMTQSTVTLGSSADLVHDVPNATSATFDGLQLTPGQVVPLRLQRAGSHSYVVHRTVGTATYTHFVTIIVQPSFQLRQVASDPHATVLPTAVFEFTNDTDDEIDIELVATSLTPSCEAELFNNQLHVLPHQTFQGEVAFANVEGHAIPTGAPLAARLNVYAVSPDQTLLKSVQLNAASCAGSAGSGEDLHLSTLINGGGLPDLCAKAAPAGALYTAAITSPGGGLLGAPTMAFYEIFTLGDELVPLMPQFPEFHMTANLLTLLPLTTLPAGGLSLTRTLPAAARGHVLRVQAIAMSTAAANGMFAATDAHDITVY